MGNNRLCNSNGDASSFLDRHSRKSNILGGIGCFLNLRCCLYVKKWPSSVQAEVKANFEIVRNSLVVRFEVGRKAAYPAVTCRAAGGAGR